jgi:hypothetical protein
MAPEEIILRRGAEEAGLTLPDTVKLDPEAEEKGKGQRIERRLEIGIGWVEGGEAEGPVILG